MTAYSFTHLPHVLQNALYANDIPTINRHFPKNQYDLDAALLLAISHSALPILTLLFKAGANMSSATFHAAVSRNNPAAFQLLIELTGFDIDSTEFGMPAVRYVCTGADESGVNADAGGCDISHAVNHPRLLTWLLESGANPNQLTRLLSCQSVRVIATPLCYAARLKDASAIDILLQHGADLDPTALYWAIGIGRCDRNGVATMQVRSPCPNHPISSTYPFSMEIKYVAMWFRR
jgi:hypothetical protein